MRDLKIVNARIPDYEKDCLREVDLLIRDGKLKKSGSVEQSRRRPQKPSMRKGRLFQQDLWISTPMRMHRREISLRQNAVSRWGLLPKSPETAVILLKTCRTLLNA